MSNIHYYKGSLFTAPVQAIAHVANCHCTMGSGIAKVIKDTYPEAYRADCETTKGDYSKLGNISSASVLNTKDEIRVIHNIYAQYLYGIGVRHLNYEALYTGLTAVKQNLGGSNYCLGLPFKMGSDRAGGDFRVVESMIEVIFEHYTPGVLICQRTEDDDGYIRRFPMW